MFENLTTQFNQFNDEQTRLYDFTVAGLQWDKEIRKQMKGRPTFSYNLLRTILNVIFGAEEANAEIGKPKPRSGGDNQLTNVVWQTLNYFLYHANFTMAQKRVFADKVIARLGVYHIGWQYNGSDDDNGKLFVEAVDPRELKWELNYNDPLWEKSSYLLRKHEMSVEEILNTYALRDDELRQEIEREGKLFFEADPQRGKWISRKLKQLFSAVYETATGFRGGGDNLFKNYMQWWNPYNGKFDVLEIHEKRTERRLIVRDSRRQKIIDITEPYMSEYKIHNQEREFDGYNFEAEIIDIIKERYDLQGEVDYDLQNRRFVTAVVPTFNLKVNEQPYPFECKYYVYIPEYCYDFHADPIKMQSVLDDLIDPQQEINKARSLILELIAKYANKGWVMDENAINGLEQDWTNDRIAPYRRVATGYINMIKPEPAQTVSPELLRLPGETQQMMQAISNTLGNEISGARNPDVKSGRHFIAKEDQQTKSLTKLFKNRSYSLRALSEMALTFIQHYVKTEQVLRITTDIPGVMVDESITVNQRQFQMVQGELIERVVNDLDAVEYDIEIVAEPYSSSAVEERYNKLGDIFNAALAVSPEKANAILPVIVKAINSPQSEEILKIWQEMEQPTPEQQQMEQLMKQIQMIMVKLGIEEKTADVEGKQLDNVKKSQEIKNLQKENIFSKLMPQKNRHNGKLKSTESRTAENELSRIFLP